MPDLPFTFGRKPRKANVGGSATKRDHSRAYRSVRESILTDDPLCRYCFADKRLTPAAMVDHIIALSLNGSNDRTNLISSCRNCNDRKAADERRFVAKGYDPRDVERDPAIAEWIRKARSP